MLTNPESRRALRAVIQAVSALVGLFFIGWLISLLSGDSASLYKIALALLGIAAMRELFVGSENVTRAVKFHAGVDGVSGSIGADEAAQVVATAAQDKADEVKS